MRFGRIPLDCSVPSNIRFHQVDMLPGFGHLTQNVLIFLVFSFLSPASAFLSVFPMIRSRAASTMTRLLKVQLSESAEQRGPAKTKK
jgi:hypothetical protein